MLWLGHLTSPSVLTELMLEKGILKGVFYYLLWLVPLFVFNLFNMMTRASGFADGILSQAKYIATGRPFSLEHLPFRNIYATFKASHLYLSFILSFIIFGFVYFLHPTVYALLSTLLVCLSIWMILPFVTNPGSTAWNTPVKVWLMLLYDDWRDYIRFQEKIILYNRHILWPSLFVIFVGAATFFQFDIKLYWVMLLVGIYIGLLTPWLKLFYFIIGFICILSQTLIGFATLPFILALRYSLKKSQVRRAPWLYDEKYGMLNALKYQPDAQTTNANASEKHNVFSMPPTITISPTTVEGTTFSPGEYPVERRLKMRLARQNTFGFDRLKPVLVPAANPQPLDCDTECNGPLHEHIQQLKGDGANVTLLPSHSFLDKPEVMMAHTTAAPSKSLNKHIENLKHKETRLSPKVGRTTLFNESPLMGRKVQFPAKEKKREEEGEDAQEGESNTRNHEVEVVVDEEIVETSPLVRRG